MKDWLGREIEYLRLSVTQDCNLNCIYCRTFSDADSGSKGSKGSQDSEDGIDSVLCSGSSCKGLTPADIEQVVGAMAGLGIKRVRITGGEPLTRADICDIVSSIAHTPGIEDVSLTTNGVRLAIMAEELKKAGLGRINISLDSMRSERFAFITGGGRLHKVLEGIESAVRAGLQPLKINVVLIRGVNDDEVKDFIRLAKEQPVEVRFIELMPVGKFGEENRDKIVYNTEIIEAHPELKPFDSRFDGTGSQDNDNSVSVSSGREGSHVASSGSGPAAIYTVNGFQGRIGFISPMSHWFCNSCNRIRLTCDGKIKLCLGHNNEVDITGILREKPEKLKDTIRSIIYNKPEGHNFNAQFVSDRGMNEIGG